MGTMVLGCFHQTRHLLLYSVIGATQIGPKNVCFLRLARDFELLEVPAPMMSPLRSLYSSWSLELPVGPCGLVYEFLEVPATSQTYSV